MVTIGLLALGVSAVVAQSGNDLFQQALVKERTDGNVSAAIALYQTIVQKHANDRALVAKALVQMGGCYEKLGSKDAITTYQRVVREFGDQKDSVAVARTRLAALQSQTRAGRPGDTAALGRRRPGELQHGSPVGRWAVSELRGGTVTVVRPRFEERHELAFDDDGR